MPRVSIITPLYNGAKTLQETAKSVLSQDFSDWEWILFDDGSTDNTPEIVKKLSDENAGKIFFFYHTEGKNHGTSFTRNRAFEKSSGEIIAFIDQDDVWSVDRLSHQLRILDSKPDCSMIWGPALYWYESRSFEQPVRYLNKDLDPGVYDPPKFIEIFLKDLKGTPLPGMTLLRREAFEQARGYEEAIRGSEDIVLWLKIAAKNKICFDRRVLMKYRKHEDSTLRRATRTGEMNEWNLIFYKWVIGFLRENYNSDQLIEENEFAYYRILKKIAGGKNFFGSRRELNRRLNTFPELKKKFYKDFLLDLVLPFDVATKVSAKLRFDIFKSH